MRLGDVARELSRRLVSLFLPDNTGGRPCHGQEKRYTTDEHWRQLVLFYEYFDADSGRGCGARLASLKAAEDWSRRRAENTGPAPLVLSHQCTGTSYPGSFPYQRAWVRSGVHSCLAESICKGFLEKVGDAIWSLNARKRTFRNKGFILSRKLTSMTPEPLSGTMSSSTKSKQYQNPRFWPLSGATSIPYLFIWAEGSRPPSPSRGSRYRCF